jgi:hypothetical protein
MPANQTCHQASFARHCSQSKNVSSVLAVLPLPKPQSSAFNSTMAGTPIATAMHAL